MQTTTFTPAQNQVLSLIAGGSTIQAAADAVGVHRNTVLNWRRSSPTFQNAWSSVHYEQALLWREQALPLAPLAIQTLRELLENPETSPAVRLRAALAIHKIVSTPPPAQRKAETKPSVVHENSMHNSAQSEETEQPQQLTSEKPAIVQPKPMHNPAQLNAQFAAQPCTIPAKIGRNEPCPCSSGRKFKHCCLNKSLPQRAA